MISRHIPLGVQVGFHNRKTQFIKVRPTLVVSLAVAPPLRFRWAFGQKTTAILRESHGGNVPESMEELLALPGVGPKMAIIVLRHPPENQHIASYIACYYLLNHLANLLQKIIASKTQHIAS